MSRAAPPRLDLEPHGLANPDPDAAARLAACLALRSEWNKTHDLVGPAADSDPWLIDVLDAAAVAAVLAPERPLVDVGAGAGVPGLLVACLEPDRAVVLVEPRVKRCAFLRTAKFSLGLDNIRIVRGRWPAGYTPTEPVQVVSRAVVSPAQWPALAASGGPWVHHIIRLLAVDRADFAVPGFALTGALDYRLQSSRRVERWSLDPA